MTEVLESSSIHSGDCDHHHILVNNDENGGSVKFEFVEEMRDRSIILDEKFDDFIESTKDLIIEVDEKPEPSPNLIMVAETVMCKDNVISNVDFMNVKWAYSIDVDILEKEMVVLSLKKLKDLNLPNNLDSVIEYADGFNMPDYMLLGLIGGICHQMGNVEEIIIHAPNGPQEKSTFYFKLNMCCST